MILLTAIAVGTLFGAGIYAMAHRDLIRLVGGTVLIANSAILLLMSETFKGREAALLPVDHPGMVADPLVQALALKAIVISFATTVLLLRVALTVEETHGTVVMEELANAEESDEEIEERQSRQQLFRDEPEANRSDGAGGKRG